MGARMYDPELGRFISPDSIVPDFSNPQSLNRYSYVLNNALKYTDPTGHRWVKYSAGEVIDERTINTQYAGEWDTAKQARNTAIFETAMAVEDTLLAMANEPYDWVSTASRCTQGECNWLDYTAMALPFVPGAVGRADDVARAADKIDDTTDALRTASGALENTKRGLWQVTREGADRVMRHERFGTFYRSISDGLWWVKDQAGHGGSTWKVYQEADKGLEWIADADQYGDFINAKHKSQIGQFISWKDYLEGNRMIHSAKEFIELRTSSDLEQQQRAAHECASDEVWFDVLRNFPEMTVWVVRNKTISLNILHQLVRHSDVNVRRAVASKRKLDKDLFAILSADSDESVRERIAYNKKTPELILRQLSEDVSERVAAIAGNRLDEDCK